MYMYVYLCLLYLCLCIHFPVLSKNPFSLIRFLNETEFIFEKLPKCRPLLLKTHLPAPWDGTAQRNFLTVADLQIFPHGSVHVKHTKGCMSLGHLSDQLVKWPPNDRRCQTTNG